MSESRDAALPAHAPSTPFLPSAPPTAADLPLVSPVAVRSSPLVRLGGFLGIAGCLLGLVVLVVGCAGYGKALSLSRGSLGLGAAGLLLVLLGALLQRRRLGEDTHVLQAAFACGLSVLGGVLEMAVWLKWPIFK